MDRVIVRDLWVSGSRGGRTGVIYERNIWSNRWGNRVVTTSLIPLTFLVWDITAPGDRPDTYYVITDLPTPFWWRGAQHVYFVLDLLIALQAGKMDETTVKFPTFEEAEAFAVALVAMS